IVLGFPFSFFLPSNGVFTLAVLDSLSCSLTPNESHARIRSTWGRHDQFL
ncbi:hypothetical protein PAXINDRAFT_168967, partial [Paxillus involutus ATCC 200175]